MLDEDDFVSVGDRGCPLLSCMPVSRTLPPMLHVLLNLGNDVYSYFRDFLLQRIEKTSPEELESRYMNLLHELKHDESAVTFENAKQEAQHLAQDRTSPNAHAKQRVHTKECKKILNDNKQ